MVTTFQFTYLHLLEAATDKKEVRLQFYLNSNGTWHSLENLLLHLLAFFKIIFFVSHFREQILFFSLQTWKMEFAQDKWSFFWPRKAKACVKSSVYFADRLMTSKRSRSLFFTAWKTSFRPPTTLQQKRKNLPYILLQLQISWSWKSKEIVNLCKEKSVSHVTRQRLDFRIFNKLLRDAKIKLQEHQTYKVASA